MFIETNNDFIVTSNAERLVISNNTSFDVSIFNFKRFGYFAKNKATIEEPIVPAAANDDMIIDAVSKQFIRYFYKNLYYVHRLFREQN